MKTIEIREDASLEAGTATLSKATWDHVVELKGASRFAPEGRGIFVGEFSQGAKFLIRVVDLDHPEGVLCVSSCVKMVFYPDASKIYL
jgi:hypothetical protein